MFVIVCLGIALSVVLLEGCMAVPDIGFPVWIILMVILWLGIPTIGTKYYESDFYKQKEQKYLQKHHEEYPNHNYCPQCFNFVDQSFLHIQVNHINRTWLSIYKCEKCGTFHTELKYLDPQIQKPNEFRIVTEEEAEELCKLPKHIR